MDWLLNAISGSAMTILVIFLSRIVKDVLSVLRYRKMPQQFMMDNAFNHASMLRRILRLFLDEEALDQIVSYASDLPNFYDYGWDFGLTGRSRPTLEQAKIDLER